jgi:uncharacterized repeat protein (TIGR01451 family)
MKFAPVRSCHASFCDKFHTPQLNASEGSTHGRRVYHTFARFIAGFSLLFLIGAQPLFAQTPVYQVDEPDAQWTEIGDTGQWQVPADAEDWVNEIWERPAEDNKWTVVNDGGTDYYRMNADGKYYAQGDLIRGAWGIGEFDGSACVDGNGGGANEDYFYGLWEIAGDFTEASTDGGPNVVGLTSQHYLYFELPGANAVNINLSSGQDYGPAYGGTVKVYEDDGPVDVPQPGGGAAGVPITGQGGTSFDTETTVGGARTNGFVVEVAVALADLPSGYQTCANWSQTPEYLFVGLAVSNPSAPNGDVFSNDFYNDVQGFGVEYDTLEFSEGTQVPGIEILKDGVLDPGGNGIADVGDLINYTFTVTNTGDVVLTNVAVTDPLVAMIDCAPEMNPIVDLDPMEVVVCTGIYALTQADIDAGVVNNTADADGECAVAGCPVNDDDTHMDNGVADPGDLINYTFTVTNTGNVTLTNVLVSDPLVAMIDCAPEMNPIVDMIPGEVVICTGSYAITQMDIENGVVNNTADADGDCTAAGCPVNDDDTHMEPIGQVPAIEILKDGVLDLGGNGFANPGDVINYTFTVTNTGNIILTNVAVTDPLVAMIDCAPEMNPIVDLDPGEVVVCTGSYAITQMDIDAGVVNNTADADGECQVAGCPVNDDDTHMEPIGQMPGIDILKDGTLDLGMNGIADPGDLINYTFTVHNIGNVTLTNVAVTDPLVPMIDCAPEMNPIADMDPGEIVVCTGSYAIVQADIDAGVVNNTADADGECTAPGCPVNDDDMHSEPIGQGPLIDLMKVGSLDVGANGIADPGDLITYTFTVTNTGNVTLTDVAVTDPLVPMIDCAPEMNPIADMDPMEVVVCTGTYAITQADIDAGVVNNTADADGQCQVAGCPVNDDDMHSEPILQMPSVDLDKIGSLDLGVNGIADPGDLITYTFTVTNDGNVTLTDVLVNDPLVPMIDCTPEMNPIADMIPGEVVVCTGTYAITQFDIDNGFVDNLADVTGQCSAKACPVMDMDPHREPIPQIPGILIDKTADPQFYNMVGQVITYTFTVTNTGNLTLSNVTVTDPLITDPPNSGTIDCPPPGNGNIMLDPGAMVVCTGLYSITQADLDAGSVGNVATATGECPPGPPGRGNGLLCPPTDDDDEEINGVAVDLAKSVDGPPTLEMDGTYTVVFTVTATNLGGGIGTYDVIDDTSMTGTGITVNTASAAYRMGVGEDDQSGMLGNFPVSGTIVTGEMLGDGLFEEWEVVVNYTVVLGDLDPADSNCEPGDPVSGTGFYNSVTGSATDPDPGNNDACEGLVVVDLSKTVDGPPTLEMDGSYTVVFTVTATNLGGGTGVYDVIDDTLMTGTGITVNTATATYRVGIGENDQSGMLGNFPVSGTIVTDEMLGDGLFEEWEVEVNYTIVIGDLDPADSDCEPGQPVSGTGFYNSVSGSDTDPNPGNNDDCEGLPDPVIDLSKTLVPDSLTLEADGSYTVEFEIEANNMGDGPGFYNVIDTATPGMGITLNTATIAYQVGVGEDDQSGMVVNTYPTLVTDEALAGQQFERWTLTMNFTVVPPDVDPGTSGCDPRPGDPVPGTGFYNIISGSDTDPDPVNDEDCDGLPDPIIDLSKTLVPDSLTLEGDGSYTVEFEIEANNIGDGPGFYDITDMATPGMGITLNTATIAYQVGVGEDDQSGMVVNTYPTLVTGEALAGQQFERWTLTMNFTVVPPDVDPGTSGCDPRPGDPEPGTGFYNVITGSTTDPDPVNDEDCDGLPDPEIDLAKTITNVDDDGAGTMIVTYEITATNLGDGPGFYDLIDTVDPATGAVIVSATLVEYNAGSEDSQTGVLAGALPYSFTSGELLVDDEALAAQRDESWTVVVEFDVTAVTGEFECNGAGTGTYNEVSGSDTDPDPGNNADCEDIERLRTTFLVTKDFSDDNPLGVTVTLDCNTGLPLQQMGVVHDPEAVGLQPGDFTVIEFVINDFLPGTLDCDIDEAIPDGYVPTYTAGATTGVADNIFDDEDGCHYELIEGGQFTCHIYNELQPVDVVVEKIWIDERPEFNSPLWVQVTLQCDGPIVGGYACLGPIRGDNGGDYCIQAYIDPNNPGEFDVVPHFEGTTCFATEEPIVGVLTDESDCEEMIVFPGQGDSCVIINTRLYAGIPTLSQYGLILLALMMFGIGAVAYRRFA